MPAVKAFLGSNNKLIIILYIQQVVFDACVKKFISDFNLILTFIIYIENELIVSYLN
jgi:hypothetical protein